MVPGGVLITIIACWLTISFAICALVAFAGRNVERRRRAASRFTEEPLVLATRGLQPHPPALEVLGSFLKL